MNDSEYRSGSAVKRWAVEEDGLEEEFRITQTTLGPEVG